MQAAVGARASPPASQQSGNLFIALMTPRWIHLETDLLMSGDKAGIPPREACRASSPGGATGVWSETGGAGSRALGSVWEKHRKISCLSIPSCWGVMRRQSGESSPRWRKKHHWAPIPAPAPNCLWPGPRFLGPCPHLSGIFPNTSHCLHTFPGCWEGKIRHNNCFELLGRKTPLNIKALLLCSVVGTQELGEMYCLGLGFPRLSDTCQVLRQN